MLTVQYPKPLSFDDLQLHNARRAVEWGGNTSLEFAAIELGGEAGECLNKVKKLIRFQKNMKGGDPSLQPIKDELADVVICASLLAIQLGIDLGQAVKHKFNETSEKHGFQERM